MRIAITAMGKGLDSELDQRFARASYLHVFGSDGTLIETIDNRRNIYAVNPPRSEMCALLKKKKVGLLITGSCVAGARQALEAAHIGVIEETSKTVNEVLLIHAVQKHGSEGARGEVFR